MRVRVSERLPMRPPRDSPRIEVWLLPPDCPMVAEPFCDLAEPFCDLAEPLFDAPPPLLVLPVAAAPPLAPVFDWPEFCADDGAARARAATVAKARVNVLILASERWFPSRDDNSPRAPSVARGAALFFNMNKRLSLIRRPHLAASPHAHRVYG